MSFCRFVVAIENLHLPELCTYLFSPQSDMSFLMYFLLLLSQDKSPRSMISGLELLRLRSTSQENVLFSFDWTITVVDLS